MPVHANHLAEVYVIGRTRFDVGIGAQSYAACELFSRHVPTGIIPTDREPGFRGPVVLPNGRPVPVCGEPPEYGIYFYCDILFNGAADVNLSRMPRNGTHIANFCFDSDELPVEWVYALNNLFDLAYVPTESQRALALHSGVRIPVGVLPIALPLEPLLARSHRPPSDVVRFGTISAFHDRKELVALVESFRVAFHGRTDVELVIHSNLAFGSVYERVSAAADESVAPAVFVQVDSLSEAERNDLLDGFDVFVNCSRGEGFSIGAREALALGKSLVLSDIGVHRDIGEMEGIFFAEADAVVPARYHEIDNRVFGRQRRVRPETLVAALGAADEFVRCHDTQRARIDRRRRAAEFSFTHQSIEYAAAIDAAAPSTRLGSAARRSPDAAHPPEQQEILGRAQKELSRRPRRWNNRLVVPAHDGGFFSVFNTYVTHLVWSMQDDRCHMVLPDWAQDRLSERIGTDERESFCYGKFSDGNIFPHLFEPVFDSTVELLDDREYLYGRSELPARSFNERLEPLLTYVHAYDLYRSPSFPRLRRQYHEAVRRHLHLRPGLQADVDAFIDNNIGDRLMLAAHVKHPSHVMEQPSALMAAQESYFGYIDRCLAARAVRPASDRWRLFVGTDQEAVVDNFRVRYGDNVCCFPDVRRTTAAEDRVYQEVARSDPGAVGFQLQHLVSARPDSWSLDMARDIIRDSYAMARADVLFHIVSNVATAISYLNPLVQMEFIAPDR